MVTWTGSSSLPQGRAFRPAHVVSPKWTILWLVKAVNLESPSRIRAQPTSPFSPNNPKCDHLLYGSEKAGIAPEKLVNKLDTTKHWKEQYENLSEFKVPSSALLCEVELDDAVKLLAPLAMPGKKGRRSTKRKDNAYNRGSAEASRKSAKISRDATPGSSSASSGASKTGQKTKGGGGGGRKRRRG